MHFIERWLDFAFYNSVIISVPGEESYGVNVPRGTERGGEEEEKLAEMQELIRP